MVKFMNSKYKQKLIELNNVYNNRKKKSKSDGILLLIAELTAETNGNVKWILWMICSALIVGIGVLVSLTLRGL